PAQAQGFALTLQTVDDQRQRRPPGQSEQGFATEIRAGIEADGDVIEVGDLDPAGGQAVAYGGSREARPMFDAIETFLLDGGNEFAIHHQRSRGVTVIRVQAEDEHRSWDLGVGSWELGVGTSRTLSSKGDGRST